MTTAAANSNANIARPRLDYIDGVRGLAAIYIVVHHLFLNLYPVIWHPELYSVLHATRWYRFGGWLLLGHFAVGAFIVLSGYCLMMPVVRDGGLKDGTWGFYTRRLTRILPTYYAAIVFCSIVDMAGHLTARPNWNDIATHVFLVNNWLSNDTINGAFWFIATQAQLYVIFPLMVYVWRKAGPNLATALFVIASLTAFMIWHDQLPWSTCIHYVGLFALGMWACNVAFSADTRWASQRANVPWGAISALALAAVFVVSTIWFDPIMALSRVFAVADLLVGVFTATGLIAAARANSATSPLRRFLELKPLVKLGIFSYSLYLIHGPLLILVRVHLPPVTTNRTIAIMTLLVVPVITAIAWVFYLLFEKPVGALKKKTSRT